MGAAAGSDRYVRGDVSRRMSRHMRMRECSWLRRRPMRGYSHLCGMRPLCIVRLRPAVCGAGDGLCRRTAQSRRCGLGTMR